MTKNEIKEAFKNKSIIYAMDCNGVEYIEFSDKRFKYTMDDKHLYKMLNGEELDLYLFSNLYKNFEDAQRSFEEWSI